MTRSARRVAEQKVIDAARAVLQELREGIELYGIRDGVTGDLEDSIETLDAIRAPLDGPAAHNGTETSYAAKRAVEPTVGSMRRDILDQLRASMAHMPDKQGLTVDELERRLRKSHQTVSSAVNHLRDGGWIEDSGRTRRTRGGHGSPATVWRPAKEGSRG